jgi:hypothetical protein
VKFAKQNEYARQGGLALRGVRNKLDSYAYSCVLAHVQHKIGEPAPEEFAKTHLWTSLDIARKESPRDYLARIISMLPKQVSFEHSTTKELSDEDLDQFIEQLKSRALERQERPMIELKVTDAVN